MKPKAVSPVKKGAKKADQSLDSKSVGVSKTTTITVGEGSSLTPMELAILMRHYAMLHSVISSFLPGTKYEKKETPAKKPENVKPKANDDNEPKPAS